MENGADVNIRDRQGETVLCRLVEGTLESENKRELTELLLQCGANVNVMSTAGITPLLYAWIIPSSMHLAPLLLEHGADINACDDKGTTLLMRACLNKYKLSVAKQLLDHGANIDAVTEAGDSALMLICHPTTRPITTATLEKIELLLTYGADLNLINKAGQTVCDISYSNQGVYNMLMETKHKSDFILK